jgi:hypothetical protein
MFMKEGENLYCGPVGCNVVWYAVIFHGSEVSHFGLLGLVWHSLLTFWRWIFFQILAHPVFNM